MSEVTRILQAVESAEARIAHEKPGQTLQATESQEAYHRLVGIGEGDDAKWNRVMLTSGQ